jgi:hypothetical protein
MFSLSTKHLVHLSEKVYFNLWNQTLDYTERTTHDCAEFMTTTAPAPRNTMTRPQWVLGFQFCLRCGCICCLGFSQGRELLK